MRSSALWRPYSSGKRNGGVQQRSVVEHKSIGQRASANQAHFLQLREIFHKAESARGGQIGGERLAVDSHLDFLRADGRMAVIGEAVHAKLAGRIDADAAVAIGEFERLDDAKIAAMAAEAARSGSFEHFDKGLG